MSQRKRQHTVPRAYLKNFSRDGKRLYMFDKVTGRISHPSVKDVAVADRFYDLPADIIDKARSHNIAIHQKVMEDQFSMIEQNFPRLSKEIMSLAAGDKIPDDIRAEIAHFIAIQQTRTLNTRLMLLEARQKFIEEVVKNLVITNFPPEYHNLIPSMSYDKKDDAFVHAHFMTHPRMIEKTARIYYKYIWLIGHYRGKEELYTSDNPVVRCPHVDIDQPWHEETLCVDGVHDITIATQFKEPSITQYGIEIIFPLNPKRIIILLESDYFHNQSSSDGSVVSLSLEQLERYNTLQVTQSSRQIFCSIRQFISASQICHNFPEICVPKRERVTVVSKDVFYDPATAYHKGPT